MITHIKTMATGGPERTPQRQRPSTTPATIKTIGYAVSTISVILLGTVSWKAASTDPLLLACLLAGMTTSMLGMGLRWISYRMEK